jgi:hypothetical protein
VLDTSVRLLDAVREQLKRMSKCMAIVCCTIYTDGAGEHEPRSQKNIMAGDWGEYDLLVDHSFVARISVQS